MRYYINRSGGARERSLALRLSIPTSVPVLRVRAVDSLQIQL